MPDTVTGLAIAILVFVVLQFLITVGIVVAAIFLVPEFLDNIDDNKPDENDNQE